MRCPSCGIENPGTNRFCGSCGAVLVAEPTLAAQTLAPRATPRSEQENLPNAPMREPERVYSSAPRDESPTISGPSFLGLNQSGPANAPRRGGLSINPSARSELRSFDYLLDEEEEERKGGAGKYVLILMALLLALGLGYLRWKNQTLGWFSTSKPPATDQAADDSNTNSAVPPSATATPSPEVAKSQPAPTTNEQPAAGSSPTPGSATGAAAPNPTPASPAPDSATKGAPPASATADNAAPSAKKDSSDSDSDAAQADTPPAAAEEKKPASVHAAKAKPSPSRSADTSNSVAEATRYIYGKGAAQDCDRGLRLLKPAANESDPRAMIQMGALYSAGLCTPRDLPTAYRWFALALRKEPDNMSVQNDLQKLWGEMTQPERQLAIRLTH